MYIGLTLVLVSYDYERIIVVTGELTATLQQSLLDSDVGPNPILYQVSQHLVSAHLAGEAELSLAD